MACCRPDRVSSAELLGVRKSIDQADAMGNKGTTDIFCYSVALAAELPRRLCFAAAPAAVCAVSADSSGCCNWPRPCREHLPRQGSSAAGLRQYQAQPASRACLPVVIPIFSATRANKVTPFTRRSANARYRRLHRSGRASVAEDQTYHLPRGPTNIPESGRGPQA
jgi:hypothetical protein